MMPDIGSINQFDTTGQLAEAVSAKIAELLIKSISKKNQVNIALSGGTTPPLYFKILVNEYSNKIPWDKVNVYWADERYVPHNNIQSNYGNIYRDFLSYLNIKNVFPVDTSLPCEQCASGYEKLLRKNLPLNEDNIPRFDLILLGMGDDGHTASLFPGSKILEEKEKFVACVYVDKAKMHRISLTFPVLNNSKSRIVVFTGENKARVFNEALEGKSSNQFPVQGLFDSKSETYWMYAE